MVNTLIKALLSIICIVFNLFAFSLSASESEMISNERILRLSIELDSQLINFYEDELISTFNEGNAKRIEDSKNYGENGSNIKAVYVKVPLYYKTAMAPYEEINEIDGSLTDVFMYYNLHTFDINKFWLNSYGFLSFPEGEGPFPCAVLCHGSDGDCFMPECMEALAKEGIASISLNRFMHYIYFDENGHPQFIKETALDQLKVPIEREIIETLFTAKLMGTHPKIDSTKIGFIGWSRGGNVSLECVMQKNIQSIYSGFQPAFCVNYYTMPLIQRKDTLSSPILFLHGANDDYTPVSRLLDYLNFALDKEYALPQNFDEKVVFESDTTKAVIYAKAGHAFDMSQASWKQVFNTILSPQEFISFLGEKIKFKWSEAKAESFQKKFPDIMNMSDCCVREQKNNRGFIGADNNLYAWKEFPQYVKNKIRKGVTLEINPYAGKDAWEETLTFIKKHTAKNSERI